MDKTTLIEVPVLVIGFNRPDILRQCIAKLRESRPVNLYLACDGPRATKENEEMLVQEVHTIMENEIDWPCEKHFRYNKENKGCEVTESEAITWVLEENDYVIVIEDDIIIPYSFLIFAQEMLYKYKDEERIFQISSNNTTPMQFPNKEDYCFSLYGHIWGWATWKRAWKHFDLYINDFQKVLESIPTRNDLTAKEKKHFKEICLQLIREEKRNTLAPKHTWDIIWSYTKWRDCGLSIVPRVHLSSNVGVIGLHTQQKNDSHFRTYDEEFEVRHYPEKIIRNIEYDEYHYNRHIKRPPYIIRQLRRGFNYIKRTIARRK